MCKAKTANGCTGHCCAAFYLPWELSELRERVQNTPNAEIDYPEMTQIADMVIPLTSEQAKERLERYGSPHEENVDPENDPHQGQRFTCKHWDEETMLCGIYETRPNMCRGYPYGGECEHGCSHRGTPIQELLMEQEEDG